VSPAWSFAACFVTATMLSAWNGALVRLLKIPAIIVTLAGLVFYRGVALILAETLVQDYGGQFSILNEAYRRPGKEFAVWILLAVFLAAVVWELFGKTPRTWLALGNSEHACRLKGLQPGRILQNAFVAGGMFLGLAAVTFVTNQQTIEPARLAKNFELDVIGGVVLGGTNIFGGEGVSWDGSAGCFCIWSARHDRRHQRYWRTAVWSDSGGDRPDYALHRKHQLLEGR
jgi:ribose/xylose/arabinose/galactoside ABC-type transport system permease subunit